jgi:hypothetical protein
MAKVEVELSTTESEALGMQATQIEEMGEEDLVKNAVLCEEVAGKAEMQAVAAAIKTGEYLSVIRRKLRYSDRGAFEKYIDGLKDKNGNPLFKHSIRTLRNWIRSYELYVEHNFGLTEYKSVDGLLSAYKTTRKVSKDQAQETFVIHADKLVSWYKGEIGKEELKEWDKERLATTRRLLTPLKEAIEQIFK